MKTLTLKEKIALIESYEAGISKKELGEKYECGRTQVYTILKNAETIKKQWLSGRYLMSKRNIVNTKYDDINKQVYQWYCEQITIGPVTGSMIQQKALEFAKNINVNFRASSGWLDSFKKRHQINLSAEYSDIHCDSTSANTAEDSEEEQKPPGQDVRCIQFMEEDEISLDMSFEGEDSVDFVKMQNISSNPNQYCRTCMEQLEDQKFNITELKHISMWLTKWASLEEDNEDLLPKEICEKCYTKIEDFYEFSKMCISSAKAYRRILNKYKQCGLDNDMKPNLKLETFAETINVNPDEIIENEIIDSLGNVKEEFQISKEKKEEFDEIAQNLQYLNDATDETLNMKGGLLCCRTCGKRFFKKEKYEACIKKHLGQNPWSCTFCGKSYRKKSSLHNHIKAWHEDNPEVFKCPVKKCGKSYKLKESIQKHCRYAHKMVYTSTKESKSENDKEISDDCEKKQEADENKEKEKTTETDSNDSFEKTPKDNDQEDLKRWSCTFCEKSYRKKTSLRNHIKAWHEDNPEVFTCPVEECNKSYKLKESLQKHCKYAHKINNKSNMESESENEKVNVNDNEHNQQEELTGKIDEKNEDSDSNDVFDKHFGKNEENKKPLLKNNKEIFECEICQKRYFKKEKYEACIKKHQGLSPWACQICGKSYRKRLSLRDHMNDTHAENPILYPCSFEGCEKVYKSKERMRNHYKVVHLHRNSSTSDELKFMCQECGKCFRLNSQLTVHLYTHTGEYPFTCDRCPKRFGTRYQLKIHCKRHDGIKNFVCTVCGIRKTTRRELVVHMNYHSREVVHKCQYCSYTSCSRSQVKQHQRVVHLGIRSYKCRYCDESFGISDTLKHHEMRHTGEKPHKCEVCGKGFIQLAAMKSHRKNHFKGTTNPLPTTKTKRKVTNTVSSDNVESTDRKIVSMFSNFNPT